MYTITETTDTDGALETKETGESAAAVQTEDSETALEPQRALSSAEQQELVNILRSLAKNFSHNQKLAEIAETIIKNNFNLSSKIWVTLNDDCNIFNLIFIELRSNQFSAEQLSDIIALLTFCAKVSFRNEDLFYLMYTFMRIDTSVEDQQKVALFSLFLKNAQSSAEMYFGNFLYDISSSDSDEMVVPILICYINRFGIDSAFFRYSQEKNAVVASILYKVNLCDLRDFKISNIVFEQDNHINEANLLLLEMLCKQEDHLHEIQGYPFFQPILAWGFGCFKQELPMTAEDAANTFAIVNKTLVLCLKKSLIKFQDKNQYLDNLECMIKKIESYSLIDLIAKHEITKTLTDDEKKLYLKKLLENRQNGSEKFRINLLRLGMHWNLHVEEISANLGGLDAKLMQGFAIQGEDKKAKEEQTIIHMVPRVATPIVDDRLFGHAHNGFWLRGTKWEGNTFLNTLGYISKKLDDLSNVPQYCRTHLQNANKIIKLLDAFKSQSNVQLQQRYHAYFYASHVAKAIQALFAKEQYIAIPAGWSDGFGSGHAVIYNIVQSQEETYLMIFNTGDGIDYHMQSYDKDKGRTQFFNGKVFLIKDLNVLPVLFTELLMPTLVKNVQQGASTIYEDILPNFFPQYIEAVDTESLLMQLGVEVIDPQFSGTCSWDVVETWLLSLFKLNENPELWEELWLKIRYHNFVEYLEPLKQMRALSGQQRLIAQAKRDLCDKQLWDKLTEEQRNNLESLLVQVIPHDVLLLKDATYTVGPQTPLVPRSSATLPIISLLDARAATQSAVARQESKVESDIPVQQTLRQLDELITIPEACFKPENWDTLQQLCQILSDNSQFDYVIYYVEKWLSQLNYSSLDNKDKDLLYKLMHKMTELNYVYSQALYKNIFVHTTEKHFMVWSTLSFGVLAEKYFQNLLNPEQIKLLQDSFLSSLGKKNWFIEAEQLLVLDQNDIALLQKIKTVLKKVQKEESDFSDHTSGYIYLGLIGECLRSHAEIAQSVKMTSRPCKNKDNISILSLIELWQRSVVDKDWNKELKDKINPQDLEKINHFFYIAAMSILNAEYCARLAFHESPKNLVEYIKDVYLHDSNPPYKLAVCQLHSSEYDIFPTMPPNHLIKKVMAIKKALDADEEGPGNMAMILLRNHFPSNFREAYLLYLIIKIKDEEKVSKQTDLINIHLFITFFKECQLKLLETYYQTFVFHALFNNGYIADLKDDPAFALLVQTLLDGVSSCRQDNHLDLAMLFYIKTIYSLYLVDPQKPVFEIIIHRIEQMIEQCAVEKNNSFLLHQLYCYQFLFAWSQYCYLEEKNVLDPETRTCLMERIFHSRLKMTQDVYTVSNAEQSYADDQLVHKFIQSAELALENYLSRRTSFVDSPEFLKILSKILNDSAILKQAKIAPATMKRVAEDSQVKFGEFLHFDFSRSIWIHQNNTYSKLIPS